jgi:serine/threonine protein phosphatase PrpC
VDVTPAPVGTPQGIPPNAPHAAPPDAPPPVRGGFEPYAIGDPGQAAAVVVPRLDAEWPDEHDTVLDGVTVPAPGGRPGVVVRAASVRGLSHRYSGKVRQDAYAFRVSAEGSYLVAAVADGVSAGPESHVAAQIAARSGVGLVTGSIEGYGEAGFDPVAFNWNGIVFGLSQRIEDHVRHDLDPTDATTMTPRDIAAVMATTIVVGLVGLEPQPDGSRLVHTVRIGDASAWVLRQGRGWEALGAVGDGGAVIADSATQALPVVTGRPLEVVTRAILPGDAFVLMTDGIGDPLGSGRGQVGAALADAWATPPPLLQFAAQVDFARKSFDDDRTVLAVWPEA